MIYQCGNPACTAERSPKAKYCSLQCKNAMNNAKRAKASAPKRGWGALQYGRIGARRA